MTDFEEARDGAALVDHIYLDHCMFGMGCGCLQVTFQACDVKQARQLYDALIPLTPIMVWSSNNVSILVTNCRAASHHGV